MTLTPREYSRGVFVMHVQSRSRIATTITEWRSTVLSSTRRISADNWQCWRGRWSVVDSHAVCCRRVVGVVSRMTTIRRMLLRSGLRALALCVMTGESAHAVAMAWGGESAGAANNAMFSGSISNSRYARTSSTPRPLSATAAIAAGRLATSPTCAQVGARRGCSENAFPQGAASSHWSTLRTGRSAFTAGARNTQRQNVDVLITGGRLVDGTGTAPRTSDVGIRGDRIVFVGSAKARGVTGTRTIDARGLVVAPGFIDPHAHVLVDLQQPSTSRLDGYLMQGVTTVLTGNDGGGPVNVGAALALWTRNGIGLNAGVYIGQGSVRGTVVGRAAVAATAAQIDSMRVLVRRAMQQGAMGLSSGLFYAPGSFATTEEVIELAKEVAPFGGVYDTHQRDESSYGIGLLASTREAMRIAKEAGVTLNISHIKALGIDVWGRSDSLIAMIRGARARGDRVFADQYPYTASGTSLTASLVPRWAEDGGNAALVARFADDTLLPRLRREMEDNMRRRGGAASLLLVDPRDKTLLGLTLAQVAERMKTDAISAAIAVIRNGGSGVASFNMQQSDIDLLAKEPWVMTGSDGSDGHPRKYGTFTKKLREYVFDRPVMALEAMVQQSSALPARVFGLVDRGEVREGNFADVIVFDPAMVKDKSTYIEPTLFAVGMQYVFVNGVAVVDGGQPNKAMPGRALKGAKADR